jgi:hypothetical protein
MLVETRNRLKVITKSVKIKEADIRDIRVSLYDFVS